MKLVRYLFLNQVRYGVLEDEIIRPLVGEPFDGVRLATEAPLPLASATGQSSLAEARGRGASVARRTPSKGSPTNGRMISSSKTP